MTTNSSKKVADATNSGVATITGFRYIKDWCIATLDNGVSGIIGSKSDMPLATMLTLKGQKITFEYIGRIGDHDRYNLGFAL